MGPDPVSSFERVKYATEQERALLLCCIINIYKNSIHVQYNAFKIRMFARTYCRMIIALRVPKLTTFWNEKGVRYCHCLLDLTHYTNWAYPVRFMDYPVHWELENKSIRLSICQILL